MKLSKLLLSAAVLVLFSGSALAAGSAVPVGDLIAYGGTYCAQVNGTWYAGKLSSSGKFVTLTKTLSDLKKKLKRTTNAKKRKNLKRQIKSLKSKIGADAIICQQFDIGVNVPSSAQSPLGGATVLSWSDDLSGTALVPGEEGLYFCPSNGSYSGIYGTFIYTIDSGLCYAAVHAGLISQGVGGNVRVRIKEGQPFYYGSLRNGIESSSYGVYSRSFCFLHPVTGLEVSSSAPLVISWTTNATDFRGNNGAAYTYLCPANGTVDSVWGTNFYTDDSGICAAAVHAGKITMRGGGLVTIRISAGLPSYSGSTKNGITSQSYGSWSGSFSFD